MTWVLLRGLTRDGRHWGEFLDMFARSAPGCRILPVDLPGTGQAHRRRSPWTIEAIGDSVRATLKAEGASPPYRVLAISMGAMVATSWAARYPGEIDAAVLINTSMRPFSPFWQRLRPRNYLSLASMTMYNLAPYWAESRTLRMTSRLRRQDIELVQVWARYKRDRPVAVANALAQLYACAGFLAPQTMPFARALLLTSALDSMVDTRCSIAIAKSWGCELQSHPQAGHDLPLDDGQWLIESALGWIDRTKTGSRG
jgi:pimeloyl-ACP methyl ester carboxylesterase